MVCASDKGTMADMGPMSVGEGDQSRPTMSALAASTDQQGFTCGCMSCQTVAPAAWSFALLPAPALPPVLTAEPTLVSVGRVPLLPPPERTVA